MNQKILHLIKNWRTQYVLIRLFFSFFALFIGYYFSYILEPTNRGLLSAIFFLHVFTTYVFLQPLGYHINNVRQQRSFNQMFWPYLKRSGVTSLLLSIFLAALIVIYMLIKLNIYLVTIPLILIYFVVAALYWQITEYMNYFGKFRKYIHIELFTLSLQVLILIFVRRSSYSSFVQILLSLIASYFVSLSIVVLRQLMQSRPSRSLEDKSLLIRADFGLSNALQIISINLDKFYVLVFFSSEDFAVYSLSVGAFVINRMLSEAVNKLILLRRYKLTYRRLYIFYFLAFLFLIYIVFLPFVIFQFLSSFLGTEWQFSYSLILSCALLELVRQLQSLYLNSSYAIGSDVSSRNQSVLLIVFPLLSCIIFSFINSMVYIPIIFALCGLVFLVRELQSTKVFRVNSFRSPN